MYTDPDPIDLRFLGSGNAFGPQGRAFSSLLLNDRYLFDCGPTILQQLHKAALSSNDIDLVLISHFHADHFFGLPFLFLDAWKEGRTKDLYIAGPPGIEERTERLLGFAYSKLSSRIAFQRHYVEVGDGVEAQAAGLSFIASAVDHVSELDCFAFRAYLGERSVVYSGDTTLCPGLLRLVLGAEVLVLECSCAGDAVHLSAEAVVEVVRHAAPGARVLLTHLDGLAEADPTIARLAKQGAVLLATDLAQFTF